MKLLCPGNHLVARFLAILRVRIWRMAGKREKREDRLIDREREKIKRNGKDDTFVDPVE